MDRVVRQYGFKPNRGGFISCPFHQEKTPSLKIYKQPGRGFHCFGCGAGGSVIDFVMSLFGIPFPAALVRLNADFNLGLTGYRPDPKEVRRLKAERLRAERERRAYQDKHNRITAEHRRLWQCKLRKYPTDPNEPLDKDFVEACRRLPILEDWLETNPYEQR